MLPFKGKIKIIKDCVGIGKHNHYYHKGLEALVVGEFREYKMNWCTKTTPPIVKGSPYYYVNHNTSAHYISQSDLRILFTNGHIQILEMY